ARGSAPRREVRYAAAATSRAAANAIVARSPIVGTRRNPARKARSADPSVFAKYTRPPASPALAQRSAMTRERSGISAPRTRVAGSISSVAIVAWSAVIAPPVAPQRSIIASATSGRTEKSAVVAKARRPRKEASRPLDPLDERSDGEASDPDAREERAQHDREAVDRAAQHHRERSRPGDLVDERGEADERVDDEERSRRRENRCVALDLRTRDGGAGGHGGLAPAPP